jgi:hypothetical protein
MTPVKGTKKFNDSNSSGLITWSGDPIECLDICTGENLNVVVHAMAEKICELLDPLDLTTLSLDCVIDLLGKKEETGTRTIVKVLQLLADNECSLGELINGLQEQINGLPDGTVTLNLGCLGDVGVYTNEAALQLITNAVCDVKSDVTILKGQYAALKNQVDDLDIPDGEEVVVTTCISGPKKVSQALRDVAEDYCEYKSILGTEAQIQTALARQSVAFNTLMTGVAGWISTPTTEAQSISNLWLLMSNFLPRIAAHDKCCAGGCDDVKLGFIADMEGTGVILRFTTGAGTYIPAGFTDAGSSVVISNGRGVSTGAISITVLQGGETDELDLSAFSYGDILDFNVDLKMTDGTNICQKCFNKSIKYTNSGCCILRNSGSEPITIVYETVTTTQA